MKETRHTISSDPPTAPPSVTSPSPLPAGRVNFAGGVSGVVSRGDGTFLVSALPDDKRESNARELRQAWDIYFSACCRAGMNYEMAAAEADNMLAFRHRHFPNV